MSIALHEKVNSKNDTKKTKCARLFILTIFSTSPLAVYTVTQKRPADITKMLTDSQKISLLLHSAANLQ